MVKEKRYYGDSFFVKELVLWWYIFDTFKTTVQIIIIAREVARMMYLSVPRINGHCFITNVMRLFAI